MFVATDLAATVPAVQHMPEGIGIQLPLHCGKSTGQDLMNAHIGIEPKTAVSRDRS